MSINIFITNWRIGEFILWGGQFDVQNQVRGIGDNGLKAQRALSPIWFVVAPLWFVNAMFCIPQMLLNSPYLGFIGETFLNHANAFRFH